MKIFICTDFRGHYPVGAAAVITAYNEIKARELLWDALEKDGLGGEWQVNDLTITELNVEEQEAHILVNGNY